MTYKYILRMLATVAAVVFVLLLVLAMMRDGWTLNPRSLIGVVAGTLLVCLLFLGVVYYLVMKKKKSDGDGAAEQ